MCWCDSTVTQWQRKRARKHGVRQLMPWKTKSIIFKSFNSMSKGMLFSGSLGNEKRNKEEPGLDRVSVFGEYAF